MKNSISVLDYGYVQHIETWGNGDNGRRFFSRESNEIECDFERGIIEAARQSTQGSFRGWDQDEKLLKYMFDHKHATPFEFVQIKSREYDCRDCNISHDYYRDPEYHQHWNGEFRRWILEVVDAPDTETRGEQIPPNDSLSGQ